jgi:hypothetical protein
MRGCNCPACRMIDRYMRAFGMTYPEAAEILESEARSFWIAAVMRMHERGLDDTDAASAVRRHAFNPPEMIQ